MKIIVLNAGSSSLKYGVYQMPEEHLLAVGSVEKIGDDEAVIVHGFSDQQQELIQPVTDHEAGLKLISEFISEQLPESESVRAVGHRVVHGGEFYSQPTLITNEVLAKIEELSTLAPLHNPPNATGIRVAQQVYPEADQVAVFDTAFHQSLPEFAYRYPLPNHLYQKYSIRVYGMHGTSHQYVANQAATYLNKSSQHVNLITIHLGNGCSMAAVQNGKSVDTSMGLSPLAGLMMGTRSGDIDPAIPYFLGTQASMSFEEIDQLLNKDSGLKGIAGENDLREVLSKMDEGDENAKLALDMYAYRIKKYIGSYVAVLGEVDALVFTAGVGENSAFVREKSLEGLSTLGISLDTAKNNQRGSGIRELQAEESKVKILVVPTNEELAIAQQTYALIAEKN